MVPSKAFANQLDASPQSRLRYRFTPAWAAITALTFTIGWFAISNLSPFLYFQF